MKLNKFFLFIVVLVAGAAAYYFLSTDRTSDTVLIGIVDANQVIVSSKIMGRIEKLYVDEGSKVKEGDLVAEIDSAELEAERNSALAVSFLSGTPGQIIAGRDPQAPCCSPPSASPGRVAQPAPTCPRDPQIGQGTQYRSTLPGSYLPKSLMADDWVWPGMLDPTPIPGLPVSVPGNTQADD